MRKSNLLLLVILVAFAAACGKSNGGGSGEDDVAEGAAALAGDYEGIGTFFTNIRVVELGSNTPPAEADCVGDIEVVVDENAADVIVGEGRCLTPANFSDYTLVGDFIDDTDFEGVITLVFSGVTHVLDFEGSIENDMLSATFAGRTPQVGNLVIDWDGEFDAELSN